MEDIELRILEIGEAAYHNNNAAYELVKERSLSLAYPEGVKAYFKQKIFDLKQEVSKESMIGHSWVINGCNYDIIEKGWILKFMTVTIEHYKDISYLNSDSLWDDLKLFMKQYFQLLNYEEIVKGNESDHERIIQPFPEYLLYSKPDELASKLRTHFSTDKGKGIRLMLEALQTNEPILLIIGNRQKTEIYISLKAFFNQDIGTYQSIFDCSIDKTADAKAIVATKAKINFILQSISK